MKDIKGTKTEANLATAFSGESQARGRYFYYAGKAREEGYEDVSRYFHETAVNEQEHAKLFCKFLDGIGSTAENLRAAIAGEHMENSQMYPDFAKTARDEGFGEVAEMFDKITLIEKSHETHFKYLLENLGTGKVVSDDWKCDNCGNIISAKTAPAVCPVCGNSDIPWSGYRAYKRESGN